MDVMERYSILAGIVALVCTVIYVLRQVKAWKPRLLIILLNPAIYYIIAVICFGIRFSLGPWAALS
ncbi:MAG: hypothetical protein IJW37_04145 [Lachnospiraceae bacterium]|nr:hypothetical protein [Lachnospiraceae bacterium]